MNRLQFVSSLCGMMCYTAEKGNILAVLWEDRCRPAGPEFPCKRSEDYAAQNVFKM